MPQIVAAAGTRSGPSSRFGRWLLHDTVTPAGPEASTTSHPTHSWWQVMCLTGVDYFSTLSYLPGIAVLAAGALSPLATLLIVALTLLGMLPMYRRVAQESPDGQGSVAMLEKLLPFWKGKFFVLTLLGFVATSWIITITLSSADATVHLLENPLVPEAWGGAAVPITVGLLLVLGGVFLLGFREAVLVAIPIVMLFLGVNAAVIVTGLGRLIAEPAAIDAWGAALAGSNGWSDVIVPAVLAFPLLVLGLSGFETGVSMMPLVAGDGATVEHRRRARIRNTKKLLTVAALIMSAYLMTSSIVTTLLIPAEEFEPGGEANGRALAYLAHEMLGEGFGTVYDISSIVILWFAGASAMAGLINIVPRYLPSYGMAPEWSRAVRPVVIIYTLISIAITIGFQADVDAQAGAYATGILAMMASASFAVAVSAVRARQRWPSIGFVTLTAIMMFALVDNIVEAPDGIVISIFFILGIVVVSLVSRVTRTTELRAEAVTFDLSAREWVDDSLAHDGELNLIASRPQTSVEAPYAEKERQQRGTNAVPGPADVIFLEVIVVDPSEFSGTVLVRGVEVDGHRILRAKSPAAPNAIAAILLALRDGTGVLPHVYFEWSEGNPLRHLMDYLILGRGDTAPIVREVLREAESDPERRPRVHVG
ncbi:amino acid transporter [Microcella daejeonensis]|uniref:amino acid transporter n=1 Tax=Microcella daejeonensis TaxID=2994971 RepID=UPI0022706004|nr:amino acid transporter [Microcella daejeonensis]WAB83780.1 amino acid transporter [Microcella daejeonensis]